MRLVLIATMAALASEVYSEPLLPEKISYQEASTEQVIPYRDGVLIESDHIAADDVMYAVFEDKETKTVEVPGIQLLFDVEQSAKGVLFLGLRNKKIVLVRESVAGERQTVDVPSVFHPNFIEDLQPSIRPRLIQTNNEGAALAGDVVWWLARDWQKRKLPEVPQFYDQFKPRTFGDVHFLDGTTLYAGWDRGEWGGMLVSIDLSIAGSQWVHLSGKPVGDESGIPWNIPVDAIVSPNPGHIWVAAGSAHMGLAGRGLHHRDPQGKWHTLIDGDSEVDRGKFKFPGPSSIEGLAADHEGRIHVLAGSAGVFRIGESGLDRLFEQDFLSHSSQQKDYIVGIYPSDLGFSRNGDVFISTNSFGVLAFRKKGDSWSAHQITLNKRTDKTLDEDSLPPSREKPKSE